MKKEIYFRFLTSLDPFKNLAFEDQLLKSIKPNQSILLLYRNSPCIVMGRFQNPWKEANIKNLGAVKLVRRQSGGGTVYHDPNNLCFSFIHGQRDHCKDLNNEIILSTLKKLDIYAKASNRSDLVLVSDERKFSGSAFKQKKGSSFHHGTLLFNSDLDHLNDLLNSPLKKITGKAIASNPSKVVNLLEINKNLSIDSLAMALKKEFETYFDTTAWEVKQDFENYDYLNFLSSWEWVIGETPYFSFESDGLKLEAHKGRIKSLVCGESDLTPILKDKKLDQQTWDELSFDQQNLIANYRPFFY